MFTEVISKEKATQEINAWLDSIGIYPDDRASKKDNVDRLISAMMYGSITVDADTGVITQKLGKPCGEIKELQYNSDIELGTINKRLTGAPLDMNIINYYAAAVTEQPIGIINLLRGQDAKTMKSVVVFFM